MRPEIVRADAEYVHRWLKQTEAPANIIGLQARVVAELQDAPPPEPGASSTAAASIEELLRREWWLNHGHDYSALYGDDGEMQCGMCFADFKRQPITELHKLVVAARLTRAAEVSGEPSGDSE